MGSSTQHTIPFVQDFISVVPLKRFAFWSFNGNPDGNSQFTLYLQSLLNIRNQNFVKISLFNQV